MAAERKVQKKHLIWLVGGGTGGHIMPLLAVAHYLKKDASMRLTYIGQKNGPEATLAASANLHFESIPSGKWRRYITFESLVLNLWDLVQLMQGMYVSYQLIRRKKPSLIFSKGSAVALPVALAAYVTHTPIVTHESDAVIGTANRIIARFAVKILTSFPASVYPAALAKKVTQVGLPLRQTFREPSHKTKPKSRPMVLITGGSQGAAAINEQIAQILPQLLTQVSVMHITGAISLARFTQVKESLPPDISHHYGVIDFTPDIAQYMKEADVVITRASSTIFELATLGKPMILIPLPSAAHNHQLRNAEIFVRYHAAVMLIQENLTPQLLYETISSVLIDQHLRHQLKEGMRNFDSSQAARNVAAIVKHYVRHSHPSL